MQILILIFYLLDQNLEKKVKNVIIILIVRLTDLMDNNLYQQIKILIIKSKFGSIDQKANH